MAVGRRHGLALGRARTAHVRDVVRPDDLVVAVCDNAHEELPVSPTRRLHWSVPDPAAAGTDDAFEAVYADIAARIDRLVPAVSLGSQP